MSPVALKSNEMKQNLDVPNFEILTSYSFFEILLGNFSCERIWLGLALGVPRDISHELSCILHRYHLLVQHGSTKFHFHVKKNFAKRFPLSYISVNCQVV